MDNKQARSPGLVTLGRISAVFGVRGWVKVFSYTDPRDGLLDYRDCLVRRGDAWEPAKIAEGRRQGKGVLVRLDGVDDRDGAADLIGMDIAVSRAALPEPEDGSYYWTDLEGLEVRHIDGKVLGIVDYLVETGSNDVLVVKDGKTEVLVPFIAESVVRDVDLPGGVIIVDWEWD